MSLSARAKLTSAVLVLLFCWDISFAQLVMMDFADSSSNATVPPPLPVMTETCGDSFNKFALIPATAKEDHEVGRLVDFDGGPGWGPFMIISGNDKVLFKIDKEGTIRVAFPFFDTDEYRLRLASLNGNLICTVQLNIRIGSNSSHPPINITSQTFEDNMAIRPEDATTVLVWSSEITTTTTATPLSITLSQTTPSSTVLTTPFPLTTHLTNFSHPMANIMTGQASRDVFDDSPFDLDRTRNVSKKQGNFIMPGGGTFPIGPRCADPFLTVAVPSDTPVNTPITKITATYQVGVPIVYSITDVVFDRFRVDAITGQVLTGPQPLSSRNLPFVGLRVAPQTRSALEFRVRAMVPNGMYCESVVRVNVISSSTSITQTAPLISPTGRNPPYFVSPYLFFSVRSCQPGDVIGRAEARDVDLGDRVQYLLDNPNNEVSVDLNTGLLRVGNFINTQQHLLQILVRAIDTTGLSTTSSVSVEFLCQGSSGLQFTQLDYRFPVFNCNAGTPAGAVTLLGSPAGPVTFQLTNPFEFSLEPNGLNAVIRLAAPFVNGNLQRFFAVIAIDARGNRAQTNVALDFQCGGGPGPIEPINPFLGPQPLSSNQNLLGFNPGTDFGGRNVNGPTQNLLLPQGGFPPGVSPMQQQLGFAYEGNAFPPNSNGFQPNLFPLTANPQDPGFFPPGGAFIEPNFRPQFPLRLLEITPPGPMPNLNPVPFGAPGDRTNDGMHQAFISGELQLTEGTGHRGPRPARPLLMGQPSRAPSGSTDDTGGLPGSSRFVFSQLNTNTGNSDRNEQQPPQPASDSQTAEDPNQRAVSPSPSQKQLPSAGSSTNPTGGLGFSVLSTSPAQQMNLPLESTGQMFLNEPNRFGGPGRDSFLLGGMGGPLPGINFVGPFLGNPMQLPPAPPMGGPSAMLNNFPPQGNFPTMGGFPDTFASKALFGPPVTQFSQFPLPGGNFASGLPDLTIQLPQLAGQTPPIFVTPLCAPPNTNFIGRVRAMDPEPNDRITYFIFSSGGTDIFDVHATTGEIRSRTALTIGTYHVDVAARDSTGRTAIMRLDITIDPTCLQPRMMNNVPQNPDRFSNPVQPPFPMTGPFNQPLLQQSAFRPNRGLAQKISVCADEFVPSTVDRSQAGQLPTINHFGIVRQLAKSGGLSIKGPTVIAVDAPYSGTIPTTLPVGTILGEFVVSGGSGTYRWLEGDNSRFEMTGETIGSLRTTATLPHGVYEYDTTVKDNIGNLASLRIRIVIRNSEFNDNGLPLNSPDIPMTIMRTQQDIMS